LNTVRAVVTGCGGYLPEKVLTNDDLAKVIDTSDRWISERTGIKERRIAAEGELTSSMGAQAARAALDDAGLAPEDIDLIILATSTPDQTFPASAVTIQAELGITHGAAFDVQAVCSGFVFALATAENYLKSGQFKRALVIGAEAFSRILDWQDRSTCVLFGDGAGAVVLRAAEGDPKAGAPGVIESRIYSDGSAWDFICLPGGGSRRPPAQDLVDRRLQYLRMRGNETFKVAVRNMERAAREVLDAAGMKPESLKVVVPHQANIRILNAVAERLGVTEEQMVVNLDTYGNTSAASIPLALRDAVDQGRLGTGDVALLVAFGSGLTWGSSLIRWGC